MFKYYAAAILSVVLTAVSQLLFKLGVNRSARRSLIFIYLNPYCLAAYAILLLVTLLSLIAFQALPLKIAAALQPFNYLLVGLFSYLFLKERLTRLQLLGALITIVGVAVYGASGW